MRRKDRELSREEAVLVLEKCEYGTLSLITPENKPYAVPLSYVYTNGAVYFHCALEGKKLNCIRKNPNAVFSAAGNVKVAEGDFSTFYESAVAEGIACLVNNPQEKHNVLIELCNKYYPETKTGQPALENAEIYIVNNLARTAVVKIEITNLTGKAKK